MSGISYSKLQFAIVSLCLLVSFGSPVSSFDDENRVFTNASNPVLEYGNSNFSEYRVWFYNNSSDGDITTDDLLNQSDNKPHNLSISVDSNTSGVFDLVGVASNSTSYRNETKRMQIYVDNVDPSIETLDYVRRDNGTVLFDFYGESRGTDILRVEMERRSVQGNYSSVNEFPGDQVLNLEILDPNSERLYGIDFNYSFLLYDRAGNVDKEFISFRPRDGDPPKITDMSPDNGSEINNKRTSELSFGFEDQMSGIASYNVSVGRKFDSGTSLFGETAQSNLSISELDDLTTWEVEITVTDDAGNKGEYIRQFRTNREPPEVEARLWPQKDFFNQTSEMGVKALEYSENQVKDVRCMIDGSEIGSDWKPNDLDIYVCGKISPEDYSDGEHDFKAVFSDERGNRRELDLGKIRFNSEAPDIDSVEDPKNYVTEPPEISFEASDNGAGLNKVIYWYGDSGPKFEEEIAGNEVKTSFETSSARIEEGKNTVRFKVVDNAMMNSQIENIDFYYSTDGSPELSIRDAEAEIGDDDSGIFRFDIENNGELEFSDGRVIINHENVSGFSKEFSISPNDTQEIQFVGNSELAYGLYEIDLNFSSETHSQIESFVLKVKANETEKRTLNATIENLSIRAEEYNSDISEITNLRDKTRNNIISELNEFNKTIDSLRNYSERGTFFRAKQRIGEAFSQRDELDEEIRIARIESKIILGAEVLATIIILGVVILVFRLYLSYSSIIKTKVYAYTQYVSSSWIDLSISKIIGEQGSIDLQLAYYRAKKRYREWRGDPNTWD